VAPEAAASFRRKAYHPTQLVEEEGADGGLVVSFEVPVNPALSAFVRSFGPAVRVLAPRALSTTIAADAAAVAQSYEEQESQGYGTEQTALTTG
jgi:predicted DNA-binding transcriptional regulator YafY